MILNLMLKHIYVFQVLLLETKMLYIYQGRLKHAMLNVVKSGKVLLI